MSLKIPQHPETSWDLETTGLSPRHGDQFYCISWCTPEGETAVCSFPVDPFTRQVKYREEDMSVIEDWTKDTTRKFIGHNSQFDYGFLNYLGIPPKGEIICTLNLIRLLKSSEPLKLKPFCEKWLGIPIEDETELRKQTMRQRRIGKSQGWKVFNGNTEDGSLAPDYWLAGPKYYEPYCIGDAVRAMAVYKNLRPGITELGMEKLLDTEQKTWKVLRAIENRGIRVYRKKVLATKEELKKKLRTYQTKTIQLTTAYLPLFLKTKNRMKLIHKINFNSPQHLQHLFYKRIKETEKFQTKSGLPSTDVSALKSMGNPIAKQILNIRACEKTIDFMNQYLEHMVQGPDKCWYIHPNFHQSIASTGRESSSAPNMQQVASGENDTGIEVRVEARSVFGPRPGHVLRSYDWKNIEVYIPAFKSKDKKLTSILLAGGDVHEETAKALTKRTGHPVSRFHAKRTFFGLQYGIGIKKLAKMLDISEDLAGFIIVNFQKEYPGLCDWMETIKALAWKNGYVTTAYGRRIEVPQGQEYKGINFYIQGTAGGILKSAKIKIHNAFKNTQAYIVLPIHDEVLVEINKSYENLSSIDNTVVECMQDNPELKIPIPIPVSISAIGSNWSKKEKVKTL